MRTEHIAPWLQRKLPSSLEKYCITGVAPSWVTQSMRGTSPEEWATRREAKRDKILEMAKRGSYESSQLFASKLRAFDALLEAYVAFLKKTIAPLVEDAAREARALREKARERAETVKTSFLKHKEAIRADTREKMEENRELRNALRKLLSSEECDLKKQLREATSGHAKKKTLELKERMSGHLRTFASLRLPHVSSSLPRPFDDYVEAHVSEAHARMLKSAASELCVDEEGGGAGKGREDDRRRHRDRHRDRSRHRHREGRRR